MPPRLPQHPFQSCATELSSSMARTASPLERALLSCCQRATPSTKRSLSSTAVRRGIARNVPLAKANYVKWMNKTGPKYRYHQRDATNYLSGPGDNTPFPSNPTFVSQPVLSEEARELIYQRVFLEEEPLKVVSADLGVDHRRVAAVVRMKEVEKTWEREGKKLAKPYSKAILEMVPKYNFDHANTNFEPINEIYMHGYTQQQLFWPVSESKHFTREDAAKAFHHNMLSPDKRIVHKELVAHHKRVKEGMDMQSSREQFVEEAKESEARDNRRADNAIEKEKKITQTIATDRFEFRFKKMEVEDVGLRGKFQGRSRAGVGWRYGMPLEDRKKDQIKIPTKID